MRGSISRYPDGMMSGPKPLHAGDGYEYLTRQVATQDRDRDRSRDLTDYYTEHGTPPGRWWGKGAALLGMSGSVTEQQMQALFGEGLHPDADRIIADAIDAGKSVDEAMKAAKIGRMLSEYSPKKTEIALIYDRKLDEWITKRKRRPSHDERTILRTDAAYEHLSIKLGRKPTESEINTALGAEKKQHKRGVTGFDCVFTPPKSVSVLWGLADDGLRRAIYECHRDAVELVLQWAEEHFALTRRGAGGLKQIDAEGLTVAMFEHPDNRTGDPNPHTHCVFSAKVQGADGTWSALDARALFAGGTSLSCMYNALNTALLKQRIGFAFEDVEHAGKEPVLEVADVPKQLRDLFSRRPDIVRVTEELIRDYRATHGRNPDKKIQIKLAQQATLRTRDSKPLPKSLREMVTEWDGRAREFFGDGRSGEDFVNEVLYWHTHPEAIRPYDPHRVAVGIGVELGGREAVIGANPAAVDTAIAQALQRCRFQSEDQFRRAGTQLRSLLDPHQEHNAFEAIDIAVAVRADRLYDPVRITHEVTDKIARRRATWTEAHIRAAVWDRLARCDFPDTPALRTAAEDVVRTIRDEHSLQLTIDPDDYPPEVCRRNGESQFNEVALTTVRYTTQAVLDAENYVREAALTPTAEFVTSKAVDHALAQVEAEQSEPGRKFSFNAGQKAIVRHLCTSGMRLDVAIGAAGTGKTTAMKAVVRAWQNDGRQVLALAPSAAAADVLSEEIGIEARTIDSLLWRVRTGNDPGIARGTMILVDEAAMASNPNLHELQRIADRAGAVVKYIGDPYQLSAVESGGLMRVIAQETRAPQLLTVVRFATEGEARASLEVRNGDAREAFDWYTDNGRISSGMTDELREQILTAYLRDRAHGVSALMMAATVNDVRDLNGAAQAALVASGEISTHGAAAALADDHRGWIGDVVVTRKNNNRLRVTRGKRSGASVDNGNLWRIRKIHRDGSVTVVGADHHGTVHLPAGYVKKHVELGYASTVHRSQGMTVERAYLLLNRSLGRALAYVGLTRGRDYNGVYVATDTTPDLEAEEQPEDPDNPVTVRDIWLKVLAREDDNLTATEVMRAEQARIADPDRLRGMYDEICAMLADTRGRHLLDRALPVAIYHDIANSDHFASVLNTIAVADAHRLDTGAMIAHIVTAGGTDDGESLITARDAAAALRARADTWIAQHLPATSSTTTAATTLETLALTPYTDLEALIDSAVALNTEPVLSTTQRKGRFYAVRDAEPTGIPPVPPRHPNMNIDLADFAEELRARLLAGTTTPAEPPVPSTEAQRRADLESISHISDPAARRARIRGDYLHYVRQLERDRARYLLDRALPVVLLHTVEHARGYRDLLDTIGLADAHRLDTGALIAHITTNGGRDSGESLLAARDAAALLRARADTWIDEHLLLIHHTTTVPTDTLTLPTTDTDALTQAITTLNTSTDVTAVTPRTRRFRALDDLDPPDVLRPIPPEYPGMDIRVADHADHLRRLLLNLPDDSPDWRARATQANPPGSGPDVDHERADADTPDRLMRRLHDLQDELFDAEQDATALEDIYRQLLVRAPSCADDEFLQSMTAQIDTTEDPAMAARRADLLDKYRAATEEIDPLPVGTLITELEDARRAAEHARSLADQLRADADEARHALAALETVQAPDISHELDAQPQPEPLAITAQTPLDQAANAYLHTITGRATELDAANPDRDPRAPIWLPAPPPVTAVDDDAETARGHYAAIIERLTLLGERAAAEQPEWTMNLGPIPDGAVSRANWIDLAAQIAAWREQHHITDQASMLGEQPDDDNHAHTWQQLHDHAHQLHLHATEQEARRAAHEAAEAHRRHIDIEEQNRHRLHPDGPEHWMGPEI